MNLPDWAADLLEAPVARLATVDSSGVPSLVPICFVVDGDLIWSAIDEKPKSGRPLQRLRNIAENPRVVMLVDRYEDDWTRLAWVAIHGRALVVNAAEHPEPLARLRAKYPQYRSMALEEHPLVRIEVETAVSWRAGG
ncbi:MAG TPA: TIGR03668 family PPOX class F420-dependent oxidoreductase [Dehalococcoidia bacterium]|nr:TIGR03668 family PPOX class F420-dependent oxidoreductase [Dehalococcoidia bacterium]